MERIKIFRNQPFVLIDDDFGEMMNWAVRYALGRRTYAGDTCRFVKSVLPFLDHKTLYVMARDIKEKADTNDLGDQWCDANHWLDLMKAITKQIEWMVEDDETDRR